jgi:hypothetical protein
VALLESVNEIDQHGWTIDYQGINVADLVPGVGRDITIDRNADVLVTIEVTERPVHRSRVTSTFNNEISRAGIQDYLFAVHLNHVDSAAIEQTETYFSQGHEVNFVYIGAWLANMLATLSRQGRESFNQQLLSILVSPEVPRSLKVSWNECMRDIAG